MLVGVIVDEGVIVGVGVEVGNGVVVGVGVEVADVGVDSESGLEAAVTHFSENIEAQAKKIEPVILPSQQKRPHLGGL